jgi:hypothetical protein
MDVPIGKTVYTCMLNKRAGVEADLTVSVRGTEEVLSSQRKYFKSELTT